MQYGEPHLEQQQIPKKRKAAWKYKENARVHVPLSDHRLYEDRPESTKESIRRAVAAHSSRMKFGKTSNHRMQHKRKKREYLRVKNKAKGQQRVCTHCNELKSVSDFDYQKDSTHPTKQRRPYCFICRKAKNAEAYLKRKEGGYYDTTRIHTTEQLSTVNA